MVVGEGLAGNNPFGPLITALNDHHHPTIREDSAAPATPDVTVVEGRWSEVAFTSVNSSEVRSAVNKDGTGANCAET